MVLPWFLWNIETESDVDNLRGICRHGVHKRVQIDFVYLLFMALMSLKAPTMMSNIIYL